MKNYLKKQIELEFFLCYLNGMKMPGSLVMD